MSSRSRVWVTVAGAAVLTAGAVVGITLATRQNPEKLHPLKGKPPISNVLPTEAASRIRAAFRTWPHGSLDTMETLGHEYPRDPVVQFYRGLALFWAGYRSDAEAPLRAAKQLGRDTPWEVQADNWLHPQYFPDYPVFVPTGPNLLLQRGSALQARGRQHSAERLYLQAAKLKPADAEAQVAAAVGRFDKDNLSASFSRLGPLTRRFPSSQPVRYYLGLLLAWTGQRDAAVTQFEKTVALGKTTPFGASAQAVLAKIDELGKTPAGN